MLEVVQHALGMCGEGHPSFIMTLPIISDILLWGQAHLYRLGQAALRIISRGPMS